MFAHANHIVLKVTKDCNLRCEYCYVKDKDLHKGEIISFDVVEKLTQRIIFDKTKSLNNKKINITLHGGEPLKIGKKNIYKVFDHMSKEFQSAGINYEFSIQTNLTYIDQEYADIFKQFNVQIGFSFDGFDGGNNLRTKSANDLFFLEKMDILKKNDIKYGPLVVATSENYKNNKINETIHFLNQTNSAPKVNLAEDVLTTKTSESDNFEINGKDFFFSFLKYEIDCYIDGRFEEMRETNSQESIKDFIRSIFINKSQKKETGNCYIKWCGGGLKVIEVEPDGTIFYCGRYSQPFDIAKVGSIEDDEFLDLQSYKRFVDFLSAKSSVIDSTGCDSCRAKDICTYGCMAFHYSKFKKFGVRQDLVCDLYTTMYDYLYERKDDILHQLIKTEGNGEKVSINTRGFVVDSLKSIEGYNVSHNNGKLIIGKEG